MDKNLLIELYNKVDAMPSSIESIARKADFYPLYRELAAYNAEAFNATNCILFDDYYVDRIAKVIELDCTKKEIFKEYQMAKREIKNLLRGFINDIEKNGRGGLKCYH